MELTLNQVVFSLAEIARCHEQIHGFKFGVTEEDFSTSGVSHPCEMWVTIQPSPVGVSTSEFTVSLCLCDSVRRGKENQTEVISDCWQIAKDVISQLRNPNYPWDFNRSQKPTVNPFKERSTYSYAGVWFDFTLTAPDPVDICRIPFSENPKPYPSEDDTEVTIYNLITGEVIDTVNSGGRYGVLEFSGIRDDGSGSYTNSIVNP